jgi:hypothetical protein
MIDFQTIYINPPNAKMQGGITRRLGDEPRIAGSAI